MKARRPLFSSLGRITVILALVLVPAASQDNLGADIKEVVEQYDVKGQAAVAVVLGIDADGAVTTWGQGAYGTRRVDSSAKAAVGDLFMVASCGKSFTAAVWGVLVTQGLVKWTDTVASILTQHDVSTDGLNSVFLGATVTQLLQHRAGFSADSDFTTWPDDVVARMQEVPLDPAKRTAIRREYALYSLAEEAGGKRGDFTYSNIGYNTAAWLSELVSGKNWEWMVTNYFALPLHMKAGFGLPYNQKTLKGNKSTGPVGQSCSGGVLSLPDYDWEAYSPFGVGSGGIYMTVGDLASWVSWHVRGLKGLLTAAQYKNISRAAFAQLHKPFASPGANGDGDYAMGWYNRTGPNRMEHDGSYAGFRSNMIGVTEEDADGNTLALAVSTNVNDDEEGVCTDTVSAVLNTLTDNLIKKYMPDVVPGKRRRRAALDLAMGRSKLGHHFKRHLL